jgi:hypothetical protein
MQIVVLVEFDAQLHDDETLPGNGEDDAQSGEPSIIRGGR